MKKTLSVLATTLCLAASGGAFAKQPVPMTDAQMDKVTAGALINVVAVDLVDINNVANNNNVQVAIPVNAAVAILGAAGAVGLPVVRQIGR